MLGFLFISFVAGVLTVLAPCVLPLLPVIVGGAVQNGGKEAVSVRRAFVVVTSLGASLVIFTLLLKASTAFISVPIIFWQVLSGGFLVFFGVVTIAPSIWDRIPGVQMLFRNSNRALGAGLQKQSVWGDVLIGAALGPVFSSCSPTYFVILASVLPASFAVGLLYLMAYVIGLCLFLFVIALLGQRVVARFSGVSESSGWFKKTIGALFVLVGIAVVFGWDKQIEAALPSSAFGEIGIEQLLLAGQGRSSGDSVGGFAQRDGASKATSQQTGTRASYAVVTSAAPANAAFLTLAQKALAYQRAPELVSPDGYINTGGQAVSLSQYVGKNVVLVDFWDYSCINCQRTLPYNVAWYQKYKDQGLVIVGVHTPEFAVEQLQSNVVDATRRFGIAYPVVLDNHYKTWGAFGNQYWPHKYLVDIDGYIVYDHIGEGSYEETESAIQNAIKERAARLGSGAIVGGNIASTIKQNDLSGINSPETYFGSDRNQYLGNGSPSVSGVQQFMLPISPQLNLLYLGGNWDIRPEYAEGGAGSAIEYAYNSRDVYFVAAGAHGSVRIKVWRDGVVVADAETEISNERLYKLVHDTTPGQHTIKIEVESGTLDAYTFTFG